MGICAFVIDIGTAYLAQRTLQSSADAAALAGVQDMLTGTKELILNGFDYDWEGMIFHPGGRVKINGDASSIIRGMIQGLQVEINGASFNMRGQGPAASRRVISLVE